MISYFFTGICRVLDIGSTFKTTEVEEILNRTDLESLKLDSEKIESDWKITMGR